MRIVAAKNFIMNLLSSYKWPLLLILSTLLVYSNIFDNQFLFDDEFLIQKNTLLRSWNGLIQAFFTFSTGGSGGVDSFYRPVQAVINTIVFQLGGEDTFAFHWPGLLFHCGNALLIYFLGKSIDLSPKAAFVAALLWALHPLHTEAVTYMSAVADTSYVFFLLLGCLSYLKFLKSSQKLSSVWLALSLVTYLVALLCKESAIVFPGLALALVFQRRHRVFQKTDPKFGRAVALSFIPLLIMAATYFILRKIVFGVEFYREPNIYTENILYRIYTALATLPKYFELLVWPHDLHMDRSFPVFTTLEFWQPLGGLGFILIWAMAIIWCVYKFGKGELKVPVPLAWVAFAGLWFFAAHSPHMGIVIPVNSLFLEHWLYLPTIGIFLALGAALEHRTSIFLPIALVLGFLTFEQNKVWATQLSFYSRILSYEARDSRVHNNYAMALIDHDQLDEAILHYREAIHLSDIYPQTHHNLSLALIRKGQISEAIQELEKALLLDPDFFQSSIKLTEIYEKTGHKDLAQKYAERAKASLKRRGL
jgi:hypothetical protein